MRARIVRSLAVSAALGPSLSYSLYSVMWYFILYFFLSKLNDDNWYIRLCVCIHKQVVKLHRILEKAAVKASPTVLWCYKKDLGFGRFVTS